MRYLFLFCLGIIAAYGAIAQTDDQGAELFTKSAFHISEVMLHDVVSPPGAARFYAYSMLGAYEVLQRNESDMVALSKNFHVPPTFTPLDTPAGFQPAFSATYAMLETGRLVLPSGYLLEAKQQELIATFRKKYKLSSKVLEANKQYASKVAAQVAAYAKTDGYFSLSTLPATDRIQKRRADGTPHRRSTWVPWNHNGKPFAPSFSIRPVSLRRIRPHHSAQIKRVTSLNNWMKLSP